MSKGEPLRRENLALVANTRKRRVRRFPSQKNKGKRPDSNQERRMINMLNIKCFNY